MEEQRKAAAPKKEAPKEESGEPKKLKYVSSRRKWRIWGPFPGPISLF